MGTSAYLKIFPVEGTARLVARAERVMDILGEATRTDATRVIKNAGIVTPRRPFLGRGIIRRGGVQDLHQKYIVVRKIIRINVRRIPHDIKGDIVQVTDAIFLPKRFLPKVGGQTGLGALE